MPKRKYSLTPGDIEKKYWTTCQRRGRKNALEYMIRTDYVRQKKLKIKIASNQKELGILNTLLPKGETWEEERVPEEKEESN